MSSIEQDYCCNIMDYYADSEYTKEHELIRYKSDIRDHSFLLHGSYAGFNQQIIYCPWCGTKLPKELGEEWCNALEEEHGLTIDDFRDQKGRWDESKIPAEFRTEEWWRKRGL